MRKYQSSKHYSEDHISFHNNKIRHHSQSQLDSQNEHETLQMAKISVRETKYIPQTFQLTQVRKSQISPLIQVKIKNKLLRDKNISEILPPYSPPKTSKLLGRAKKIQDQTQKFLFIKDWEKNQWDYMLKQQKLKKNINDFQANPQFDVAKCNYPMYNIEDMTIDQSKNVTFYYDKEKISNYGNNQNIKPQKKFYSVDDDQETIQKLSDTLEIYQKIDCSIRGMIMNRELGCLKDKQSKYLSRNLRIQKKNPIYTKQYPKTEDIQIRAQTTVIRQGQNKSVNCSLDITPKKFKKNIQYNPFQKEQEILNNPYLIYRKNFTLQKIQKGQWQNFYSASRIGK